MCPCDLFQGVVWSARVWSGLVWAACIPCPNVNNPGLVVVIVLALSMLNNVQ